MALDRNQETIAHSFDFDDMLATEEYKRKEAELVALYGISDRAYDELAEFILEKEQAYFDEQFNDGKHHVIFVGTNRQDAVIDYSNGERKGTLSCYPFFAALERKLNTKYGNVELNKLLMEDLYHSAEPGTTFDENKRRIEQESGKTREQIYDMNGDMWKAILERKKKFQINADFDNDKIMLVYMQMHYAKLHNPGLNEFVFTDDNKAILQAIYNAFNQNPHLIPPGMKLRLVQHIPLDNQTRMRFEDKGTSEIDKTQIRETYYGFQPAEIMCSPHSRLNANVLSTITSVAQQGKSKRILNFDLDEGMPILLNEHDRSQTRDILDQLMKSREEYNNLKRSTHKKDFQKLITKVESILNDDGVDKKNRAIQAIEEVYRDKQNQRSFFGSLFGSKVEKNPHKFADKINNHPHSYHFYRMLALTIQNHKEKGPERTAVETVMPTPYHYDALMPILPETKKLFDELDTDIKKLNLPENTPKFGIYERDIDNARRYMRTNILSDRHILRIAHQLHGDSDTNINILNAYLSQAREGKQINREELIKSAEAGLLLSAALMQSNYNKNEVDVLRTKLNAVFDKMDCVVEAEKKIPQLKREEVQRQQVRV